MFLFYVYVLANEPCRAKHTAVWESSPLGGGLAHRHVCMRRVYFAHSHAECKCQGIPPIGLEQALSAHA